ncbi:uncharacterized protein si:dkey-256h2.1 [Syngnathoides biaculeatus]|uniref:uncharacterized protein si:dkey-256h2.1 n=1 Tax=Syngnathoides biaculeatus TaxID=300417 RepID=UPI002ADD739A|nr:uncharacterized protein si:dkey-256h2.1 [Syngnathoides biaculeatus]
MLRSASPVLYFLLVVGAHVTFAADRIPRRRLKLAENEASRWASESRDNSVESRQSGGLEPGDPAAEFTVPTLDGEFVYLPGAAAWAGVSLLIHAFTNKSAFLECLWSSSASLGSLVEELPASAQVLFLSLDDSAAADALWMRERLHVAAKEHGREEVLSRLHVSPVPVFAIGNWIASVLYSWACTGHNCGLAQAVFTSQGWDVPVIVKRLDARYDWLTGRWAMTRYRLRDAGDGCEPSPSVGGAVAWLAEGNCSFFTKVQNMAKSNASGVLVYAHPGNAIQDMNCVDAECFTPLSLPAAMVHLQPPVAQALRSGVAVNVSFQTTPSPNFFTAIDQRGALAETGWFLYPSFSFVNWQAQWFDFSAALQVKLDSPATVVPVFDKVQMQGDKGAVADVDMPPDLSTFDTLTLDARLSCPGGRDASCPQWDHTVRLFVCCDRLGPYCRVELGRWITTFRRGIGRWQTDVSPLLPVLDAGVCRFTMKTAPWAMPWIVSLNLRFSVANLTGEKLRPFRVMSLYDGGTFDKTYNRRYLPIKFPVPASARKVELYAVITGHGSDDNGCAEFCVTSHHFLVNAVHNNTRSFDSAGSALGCAEGVTSGAVPNEHGTWLYGRGGWCDGLQVDPWRLDVTTQLDVSGQASNTVRYLGLFNGKDPDPTQQPGYIVMSSFLVFYK